MGTGYTVTSTKISVCYGTVQPLFNNMVHCISIYMHAIDTYIHSFITPYDSVYNSYNAYFMQDEGFW